MSMEINVENVLSVLEENDGLSSTAISRLLGYSKNKPAVAAILEDLEDDGIIRSDASGPFVKYFVVDEDEDIEDEDDDDDDDEEEVAPAAVTTASDLVEKRGSLEFIPENTRGYVVVKTDFGYNITFPDNGRTHELADDERLLVINDDRRVVITSPEDILAELKEYSDTHGFTQYIVTDVATGRALAPNNIDVRSVLIFVAVSRHNKAGN